MAKSIEQSFKDGYGDKKVAKKNKERKHTNDSHYGDPKGGHNTQNLPTA
tara:strand:+ start:93 stop:239 length:147 start_codon:yes stop_codon:yes gene_type:complete